MGIYDIRKRVESYREYVFSIRKHLHENPELSNFEFQTSSFLKNEIRKIGLAIDEADGTGFIAILDTGKDGKTLAMRTDIDALPIEEDEYNLVKRKKHISKNDGVMHACGHDGHMSIIMGTLKILNDIKDKLTGKILFLFEEAEENGTGIIPMLKILEKYNPDGVYGNHVLSYLSTGMFGIGVGPRMSGIRNIEFDVIGRGGHGSRPDLAVNPLNAIAQIISNMGTVWANQIDVTKTVTLGVTKIEVGTAANVIADRGHVSGTIRYFDESEGEKAFETFKYVAEKIAQAHRCEIEFDTSMDFVLPPVLNDQNLTKIAQNTVINLFGKDSLDIHKIWYASESFSMYSQKYPSVFTFIGISDEEFGSGSDQHTSKFDFDDEIMIDGIILASQFAIDFLESK